MKEPTRQQELTDQGQGEQVSAQWDLELWVDDYARRQAEIERLIDLQQRTEHQIIQALDAQGATVLDHPRYNVEVTRKTLWDREKLYPLAEHIPPDTLAEGYTPAHEEVIQVQAKWNMTKVLVWRKLGRRVQDIIESAKIEGTPHLKVVAKADKNGEVDQP